MRNYGRFTTTIFRDDDFRELTVAEQGVYFMLGLQPEVSAAGTLPLTLRRWASMSAKLTRDDLAETLSVLDQRGHIVVDWDTEELLITKFVKWDGGIGNEKRRPVILEAGCAIASERIRHRLAYELARLDQWDMASRISEKGLSDAQSRFDRVVETDSDHIPQPTTPDPESATQEGEPRPRGASADPPAMFCKKHPNGADGPCGACADARRLHNVWQVEQAERERAELRAERLARQNCTDCGGSMWLESGEKCTHPNSRRSA